MTILQGIILAIVQGLTEFLPVSSSGHLAVIQNLFNLQGSQVAFDVLLHLGTLTAILFYFRSSWKWIISDCWQALKPSKKAWSLPGFRLFIFVIIGTIPAGLFGIFFKDKIESVFNFNFFIALAWIFTGGWLLLTRVIKPSDKKLSLGRSLAIGVAQAIALFPGVSRSGSTIMAGWLLGVDKKTAFHYSFYLAIPAILGATILEAKDISNFDPNQWINGIIGFVVSAIVGFFALKLLDKVLKSERLYYFGFYCIIIGIVTLVLKF